MMTMQNIKGEGSNIPSFLLHFFKFFDIIYIENKKRGNKMEDRIALEEVIERLNNGEREVPFPHVIYWLEELHEYRKNTKDFFDCLRKEEDK